MDNWQREVRSTLCGDVVVKALTAILSVSLLSGCGKVLKEGAEQLAKKTDDAIEQKIPAAGEDFDQKAFLDRLDAAGRAVDEDASLSDSFDSRDLIRSILAQRLPAETADRLLNFEHSRNAFELYPFRAYYTGEFSTKETREDLRVEVSLNRGCDWNYQVAVNQKIADGTSISVKEIFRERLDGVAAMTRLSTELTDSNGLLLAAEDTQAVLVKTQKGYDLEFTFPDKKTIPVAQEVLFSVSAVAFELSMIREGAMAFRYKYAFPWSEQYFQIADVLVEPLNTQQLELWRVEALVGDVENGTEVFSLEERVVTKNGVEVFSRYRDDDVETRLWLTGFEQLSVETCN